MRPSARGRSEHLIDETATKGILSESITRLEYTVNWRRSVNIDDVEAMALDCSPEVRHMSALGIDE